MQHPGKIPPEKLRQMGIKELRQREEFLKKRISDYSSISRSSKGMLTCLAAEIEKIEGGHYPPNSLEARRLASYKRSVLLYSKSYPIEIVELQTSEDELAVVHRELEWRHAERQLAQRGEPAMWLWILMVHHAMLFYGLGTLLTY